MSSKNPVIERTYYYVKVRLASPISIHGSDSYYTDGDVLVNGNGEPFIPGSSIAGALRGYLGKGSKDKCVYGFSDGDKGQMSSVFISDVFFGSEIKIGVRDRVALGAGKTVQNKFDLQMIETGAAGIMRFEYVKRKEDPKEDPFDFKTEFVNLVYGIEKGEIRFGADKTRGFGRLKVESIAEKSFAAELLTEWMEFCPSDETKLEWKTFEEWSEKHAEPKTRYVSVTVPLRLTGGISIRRYSTRPDAADFEHLTCNGDPVIPGSSWNGAIRSDAKRILTELGCKGIEDKLNEWFGFVKVNSGTGKNTDDTFEEEDDKAQQSMIVIGESILKGSKAVPMTRNKINRFTGGTVSGALYSEIAYFGGTTDLEILIKKDGSGMYKPLLGLISLVIKDIAAGYVSVGGQTAVGRGIFEPNGEASYQDGAEEIILKGCLEELVNVIKGGGRK